VAAVETLEITHGLALLVLQLHFFDLVESTQRGEGRGEGLSS
jgi:hypothetical protein